MAIELDKGVFNVTVEIKITKTINKVSTDPFNKERLTRDAITAFYKDVNVEEEKVEVNPLYVHVVQPK